MNGSKAWSHIVQRGVGVADGVKLWCAVEVFYRDCLLKSRRAPGQRPRTRLHFGPPSVWTWFAFASFPCHTLHPHEERRVPTNEGTPVTFLLPEKGIEKVLQTVGLYGCWTYFTGSSQWLFFHVYQGDWVWSNQWSKLDSARDSAARIQSKPPRRSLRFSG